MNSSENLICFYCSEYAKVVKGYPKNIASKDEKSFTPRCSFHWKFKCNKCGEMTHFNGIAWCSECRVFTCLGCMEEKMVRSQFLVYNYYYNIPCHKCGKFNPALDFEESHGTHPYQTGYLQPDEDIFVWTPKHKKNIEFQEFSHNVSGFERVLSLGKAPGFKRLESVGEYTPKSTWDALAPFWLSVEEENYHHKYLILPDVYRMLNVQKGDNVLDVACGKGDVARYLTRKGAKVTGIDISKMLDYAIKIEEKEKLGINYFKLNAEKLIEKFERESFDKVVCNMALMDIEDYKTTIKQISYLLKEHGIFVFSISHPALAWYTFTTIRIPEDSQRNEDKVRIFVDYFDERPVVFSIGGNWPSMLAFHRPISLYLNELVKHNLIFKEMSEPKASEELVEKFPRNAYMDDDIKPNFLIVKTMKKSDF
ncbi:MAG: class I SAM-dependent methyltransferase [Promethearchaeota archaeon]|jgi:SAM-dependent methyltransferase